GIWSLGQKRLFFRHFPAFFSHVAPLCSFKNLKTDEKIARFCLKHQIPNMLLTSAYLLNDWRSSTGWPPFFTLYSTVF
ncbi:MAG: hypothetical protein MUC59_18700, partial [Saprospiraceae bacterium]|nr:hypothetical protein [Saprospiraceae bacterium]